MGWSRTALFTSLFVFLGSTLIAQPEPIKDGPVHEAVMTPVTSQLVLKAIPSEPPRDIRERIPEKPEGEFVWIPGYWEWDEDRGDFVWITGVWRKPPPGHDWIPGYWKDFDEGWVWVRGFWSQVPYQEIEYLSKMPPDSVDEDIGNPPSRDHFWVPGYWLFDKRANDYLWVPGLWEFFDPNWVLVPAHYVWRPGGFVFIPAYWDWPLEQRGELYVPYYIPPYEREGIVLHPVIIYEHDWILHTCFHYYPYYNWFFWHHHHFHPGWWANWCCAPPWWGWQGWWAFPHHHHWQLWWWWGHPGFPQPWWLGAHFAGMIFPPGHPLFNLLDGVLPPWFVLKNGIIGNALWMQALQKKGLKLPLLPADPSALKDIVDDVMPNPLDPSDILEPTGDKGIEDVPKPWIKPETAPPINHNVTPSAPPKPNVDVEVEQPPIEQVVPLPPRYEPEPPPRPRIRTPRFRPIPRQPYRPPPVDYRPPPPTRRPYPQPRPRPWPRRPDRDHHDRHDNDNYTPDNQYEPTYPRKPPVYQPKKPPVYNPEFQPQERFRPRNKFRRYNRQQPQDQQELRYRQTDTFR